MYTRFNLNDLRRTRLVTTSSLYLRQATICQQKAVNQATTRIKLKTVAQIPIASIRPAKPTSTIAVCRAQRRRIAVASQGCHQIVLITVRRLVKLTSTWVVLCWELIVQMKNMGRAVGWLSCIKLYLFNVLMYVIFLLH